MTLATRALRTGAMATALLVMLLQFSCDGPASGDTTSEGASSGKIKSAGLDDPPLPAVAVPTLGSLRMNARLRQLSEQIDPRSDWTTRSAERISALNQKLAAQTDPGPRESVRSQLAFQHLVAGDNNKAQELFQQVNTFLQQHGNPSSKLLHLLATSQLRSAEQDNCIGRHTPESCIFPLRGGGLHKIETGSRQAITTLTQILEAQPRDLTARWLLNLAHMTVGEYPAKVPERWRIPVETWDPQIAAPRFTSVGSNLSVDDSRLAGGSILEDFDNDGDLDLAVTSWGTRDPMRLFINDGQGRFRDHTDAAGIAGEWGGLNICQADYDNDGWIDILILRGAWMGKWGEQPNSLLRNLGNGTFDNVTEAAGIYSERPTQTASWGDFDNDGDLDLFVGNETESPQHSYSCELFVNQGDGTFREQARRLGIDHVGFVKGVACGDYDNDGDLDLYLSQLNAPNALYRNDLDTPQKCFVEVAPSCGVADAINTFPTWFFDYDNDGDLDLFAAPFPGFTGDNLEGIVADYLGLPCDLERAHLFENDGHGKFKDVAPARSIDDAMLAMGANFGDFDNDGYLDLYIGTGEPNLHTLVPNRAYRNVGGKSFERVTVATGLGHLQKGHAISFGDVDNDGDQDIYAVVGGAFESDIAYNALFLNAGSSSPMLTLTLEGIQSNRYGIGARVEISFESDGIARKIFRSVSSGGSFGASTFRIEAGLGESPSAIEVRVRWPSEAESVYDGLVAGQAYQLIEDGRKRQLPRVPILFE